MSRVGDFVKIRSRATESFILSSFLLVWALIFGVLVRLTAPALTDFPLMDGGLFYTMTQDILRNNLTLPFYTSFNAAGIPLAYPPLAFYMAAFLVRFFGFNLIEVIHWLPPLISVLTIPAFYLLSSAILGGKLRASLATVAFSMLPVTFGLNILGGGLTRSFGALFCLLTLYSAYKLYICRQARFVVLTALFASLIILAHPETSFHTLFLVFLFWLFFGRDKQSLLLSLAVAVVVIISTSPWWLTIILWHGITPFASILQSGWHQALFFLPLLTFEFPGERFLDVIAVLGVIGWLSRVARKDYFLPTWLVLPFIVEPRNPGFFAAISLAMLAAVGFDEVVLRGLLSIRVKNGAEAGKGEEITPYLTPAGKLALAFFLIYPLINTFSTSLQFSRYVLSKEEREAFQWVVENTPPEARFLVLVFGGTFSPPVHEWLPALTGRVNIAVAQGYEWLPGGIFEQRRSHFASLIDCVFEEIKCAEAWADLQGERFDYVFVYQGLPESTTYKLGNEPIHSMRQSSRYKLVYETEWVKIFSRSAYP